MKNILILAFLLSFSAHVFGCECPEYNLRELDSISYEWSDVVLIGKIIKVGTKYRISVQEILKGQAGIEIIGLTNEDEDVINTCNFYPSVTGEYLLYLKKVEKDGNTFYYSSECLGTRLLSADYLPPSLLTEYSKEQIITQTFMWLDELRKQR